MSFVRDLAISGIPLAHEAEELLGPGSPGHSLQEVLQGQRQLLLRLVTVGPVGPVAEVVRGSHLLAQRLRRGQEEHGESQREPHRRLDVLWGQKLEPWQPGGRAQPRTHSHTAAPGYTGAHPPSHG